MARIKVGILGGSGYGGSELLRILLFHPQVEVSYVAAGRWAGRRVDEAHPNLRGRTDLTFEQFTSADQLPDLDCLFLALPHGRSLSIVPQLPAELKIVDLAGDFRLSDAVLFEEFYGKKHPSMELQDQFVYGLTEVNREKIRRAHRIANPGCFATAALIGLYPLIMSGLTTGRIVVDAKTGSSGSGATAKPGTHHPVRSQAFYGYKVFSHQHQPEIVQTLVEANPDWNQRLIFQTHSAPMVRGIFVSIYSELTSPSAAAEIAEAYARYYGQSYFVRMVDAPNVAWVKNSNFTDLGWAISGSDLITFVAIDNLVKGAAGQAIQNMNLMFGWAEETGLEFTGGNP